MINKDILLAGAAAFIISLAAGLIFIPILRRLKLGQNVRDEGPKRHLQKSGTPTIGGIIIFAGLIIAGSFLGNKYHLLFPVLLFTIASGMVGFVDDYIKVVNKRSLGLTAMQKMLGLILISVIFTLYVYNFTNIGSKVIIPFFPNIELDLGALYVPFTVFFILAMDNSVNLTDGLDGLAAGITVIVSIFFIVASLVLGNIGMTVFSIMLAGSCIGFLVYNIYPAKVFMGDTGSLALGAALAGVAIILRLPIFLIIVGGIFLVETLSVILQVTSFKSTGKRILKMAPLHHHFELSGWKETKVVLVFWTITAILNILGILALI